MINKAEQLTGLYGSTSIGQKIMLAAIDSTIKISPELIKDNVATILDVIKGYQQEKQISFFGSFYKSAKGDFDLTLALDKQSYMFSQDISLHRAEKEIREKNVAIFCDTLNECSQKEDSKSKSLIDAFLMQMALAAGDHKRFKELLDKSPSSAWDYGFHRSASAASIALMYPPALDEDDPVKKEYIGNVNKCGSYVVALEGVSKEHHESVYFTPFVINPKTCSDKQFELLNENGVLDEYAVDISRDHNNFSHYLTMMQANYLSLSPDDKASLSKFEKRRKLFFDKVLNLLPRDYVVESDDVTLLLDKVSLDARKFNDVLTDDERLRIMLSQRAVIGSQEFDYEKNEVIEFILANKDKLDSQTKVNYLQALHFNSLGETSEVIISLVRSNINNLERVQAFKDDVIKCGVQPDEVIKPEEKAEFAKGFAKAVVHSASVEYGRGNVLNTSAKNADYVNYRSYFKFTKDMMYKTASNFLSIFGVNKKSRGSAEEVAKLSQEIKNALNVGIQAGI